MSKVTKVGNKYRNYLSRIEGGETIEIKLLNGHRLIYDKIKDAQAYLDKIAESGYSYYNDVPITEIRNYETGELYYSW